MHLSAQNKPTVDAYVSFASYAALDNNVWGRAE